MLINDMTYPERPGIGRQTGLNDASSILCEHHPLIAACPEPPAMHPPVLVRGTGSIGMRHLRILRDHLGRAAAAWPVRPTRAEALRAEGWTVADGWTGAAIVATDTGRHLADIAAALEAGAHVLAEKPLTPDARGLASLAALAQHVDRRIYVAAPLRFALGLQQARQTISRLGPLHGVRIECQSYLPDWRPRLDHRESYAARPDEGGVLRDLIHEIDYAVWLFGRPERVFARFQGGSRLDIASEAGADLLWQSPDDVTVSLRLDYLTRTPRRRLSVYGTAGELHWDAIAQTVTLYLAGAPPVVTAFPQERDAMMAEQTAAFLQAVSGGDPGVLSTFAEGAFAVSLCDAARRSARSSREEPIIPWQQ
jgi:predicted dehydrogenase